MKKTFLFLSIALLGFVFSSFTTSTLDSKTVGAWTRLGTKKVNYNLDRDVIHVGVQNGRFTKLKLEVTGGSLNLHKMIIEYGNGDKETIQVRQNFARGTGSRIIDLKGNKRVIRDITFFYDTKNRSRKRATLHVFGRR